MCACVRMLNHLSYVQFDSAIPWTVACQLVCLWNSPSKNTGVCNHSLLQGIFSTQGSTQVS